ncbi:ABC transporter permease [Variovorax sp. M-6]|uniref:ABC transporter permease n=1 Tax=Variovorax sp. M-6 TaxID=3233041 RepID=UPI003F9AA3C9
MKDLLLRFLKQPAGLAGCLMLGAILALAFGADWLYPGDPWAMVADPSLPPLSPGYLFGTDMLGRDVAAGVAHGARVSLLIGVIATVIAVGVGTLIGAVAGYYGGVVDDLAMRFTEIFQTIPGFLLALLMVAIFGPSLYSIVFAIGIISWPSVARLVRAEFLSMRTRDFVKAAVLGGQSGLRIVFRQILPNTLSPIVVAASLMMATAILLESAISFLGLGDRRMITWGFMIGAGRTTLLQSWWLSALPGAAIFVTVLGLNFLGDALNQALSPRRRPAGGHA